MIIFMSDLICVTNRALCGEDFLKKIERIAEAHPKAIILREKDLTEKEYFELAEKVMKICERCGTVCILHSFFGAAESLGCRSIHLPLHILREMKSEEKGCFEAIGASCHSVEDAKEAEKLGCTYITAGHVFDTACKKGLPARGLDFLELICNALKIPVYAIGGIGKENYKSVKKAGAAGACIMSGFMVCENVTEYMKGIEE